MGHLYSLPTIECEDRGKIMGVETGDKTFTKTMCTGLNPDKVYKTMFPLDDNPISGFEKLENQNYAKNLDENIKYGVQLNDCAKDCLDNKCAFFTHQSEVPTCNLHQSTSFKRDDKRLKTDDISTFERKKLNYGQAPFKDPPLNFLRKEEGLVPEGTKIASYKNIDMNSCLNSCLNNDKCESVSIESKKPQCGIYGKYNGKQINSKDPTQVKDDGVTTYLNNSKEKQSILSMMLAEMNIPDTFLKKAYKAYPADGLSRDSICSYDEANNKCYMIKKKTCKGYSYGEKSADDGGGSSVVGRQPPCMPPDCKSDAVCENFENYLRVNGKNTLQCDDDHDKCMQKFAKTRLKRVNDFGQADPWTTANPRDRNMLFERSFDKGFNTEFQNADRLNTAPNPDAFEFVDRTNDLDFDNYVRDYTKHQDSTRSPYKGCADWCSKSRSCGGFERKDRKCYYYRSKPNILRQKRVPKNGTDTYVKRCNKYSDSGILNRGFVGVPSSSSERCPSRCVQSKKLLFESFGNCSDNKTPMINEFGTNCPTFFGNCNDSAFGCCDDKVTTKRDKKGSNCRKDCEKTEFGCCPGTTDIRKDAMFSNCVLDKSYLANDSILGGAMRHSPIIEGGIAPNGEQQTVEMFGNKNRLMLFILLLALFFGWCYQRNRK